jgi:ABC-2 type transport system permease protein
MNGFRVALRKEWMELRRTNRLVIVGVVLLTFGLLSPLMTKFLPEIMRSMPESAAIAQLFASPTLADAVNQYVKNIAQFGLILALLLSMGMVAQEKERGTAAMMLVKPLPRRSFLAAKFAALFLLFLLGIALAGLAAYYYTYLLFGALDIPRWLALNGLLLMYVMVYVSLTMLFSVATKSFAAAGGLAFGLMLVLEIMGAIPGIGKFMPAQLIGWGIGLTAGDNASYWPAFGVCLAVILASFVGAWRIFERQEL